MGEGSSIVNCGNMWNLNSNRWIFLHNSANINSCNMYCNSSEISKMTKKGTSDNYYGMQDNYWLASNR